MNSPFFSIVLPTYNRATFLPKAIESVLGQQMGDWELVIVDDGSTDNTRVVVKEYKDERIKYQWQENQERSLARNNGINLCKGEYICFLDSDDYFLPEHLLNIYAIIEKQKFPEAVFMTGMQCRDIKDNDLNGIDPFPEKDNLHIYILENSLPVSSSSLAVHYNIFKKHLFEPRLSLWEDSHLWIRVLSEFPLFQVTGRTSIAVAHEGSSITGGIDRIDLKNIRKYQNAINDLFINYPAIFNPNDQLRRNYLDAKFKMYLYYARQNRQLFVSFQILLMAIGNKFSTYFLIELLKIPLNAIGFGLIKIHLGRTVEQ